MSLEDAIWEAAKGLPKGWDIRIDIEPRNIDISLYDPDGDYVEVDQCGSIAGAIRDALGSAIGLDEAEKEIDLED